MTVRLYLDSADREACEPLLAGGLFAGLTTNPTILRRAGLGVADIPRVHEWATAAGAGEVFFQAWGEDAGTLTERGLRLRDLGPRVVVKLPVTPAGTAACVALARRGVPTLLTAVYTAAQALAAAAAGATYIAPYLGRLEDGGADGLAEVAGMQRVLSATGSPTLILLASLRSVPDVVAAAGLGVRCFTMGPAVARTLLDDERTRVAVAEFEEAAAWRASPPSPSPGSSPSAGTGR